MFFNMSFQTGISEKPKQTDHTFRNEMEKHFDLNDAVDASNTLT